MAKIIRLTLIIVTAVLLLAGLLGGLAVTPSAAKTSLGPAPSTPGQNPPPTSTLHYKSAQGLMPPAYTLDPSAPPELSAAAAASIPFLQPYTVQPVGSWPQVIAAADFNGDAKNEVAIPTDFYFDPPNDNLVHILAQSGGTLSLTHKLEGGQYPHAIVAADLTMDDAADLVVALSGEDTLAVYTQTLTPTMALSGPTRLDLPGAPNALAVGDFSGDLYNDLAAVAPEAHTIHFWQGTTPTLAALPETLPYPTDGFDDLDVGDVDNDGDDDVVALRGSGYLTSSLVVYLQDNQTFPISYTLTPETGGFLPHSLAVGDVTGDGRDDIVATAGGNTPDAYLNVFVQMTTTLAVSPPLTVSQIVTTPTTYPAFHLPSAVQIADLNHDGLDDVVLLNDGWRTVSFFEQNSSGGLKPFATAELPYVSYHRPDALAIADLNGNGGLDVGLVGYYHDLTLLYSDLTAPTAVISTPLHAATVPPGALIVTGTTSPGTDRVEIRLRGGGDWVEATVTGETWQGVLDVPDQQRPWWIEARAIIGTMVQAPADRHRVRVATVCYAIADNQRAPGSPDRLLLVNLETAGTALIGDTGTDDMEAIAVKPGSDLLYGADGGQLGLLDLETGEFTPTTSRFGRGNGSKGKIRFSDVNGLDFDPTTGILYGVHQRERSGRKDLLFQIDPDSGAFIPDAFGPGLDYVVLDGSGLLDDMEDIAFAPDSDQLYGISTRVSAEGYLVTIDKTTGAAVLVGGLEAANMEGLGFTKGGSLYGTSGKNGPKATRNHLYQIDSTTGLATAIGPFSGKQDDYEGIACLDGGLAPGVVVPAAPQIGLFNVNGGATETADPAISLRLDASPAQADLKWVFFREYRYDQAADQWVEPVTAADESGWLAYTPAASYAWSLQPVAGVKYLQAWVADETGTVSHLPYQLPLNYTPANSDIAEGEVQLYRYALEAGQQLVVHLEVDQGDPDLYIWPSDYVNGEPAWISNANDGSEKISLVAPVEGLYQIEVHGHTAATYHLTVEIAAEGDGSTVETINPDKSPPATPVVPLDSEPSREAALPDLPSTPPSPVQSIYMPLILR